MRPDDETFLDKEKDQTEQMDHPKKGGSFMSGIFR